MEDTVLKCISDVDFMVVRDSLQVLQRFTKAVNGQLRHLSAQQRMEYIGKHSKLIKRFLKVHNSLVSSSHIFFKVLHYDKNTVGPKITEEYFRVRGELVRVFVARIAQHFVPFPQDQVAHDQVSQQFYFRALHVHFGYINPRF